MSKSSWIQLFGLWNQSAADKTRYQRDMCNTITIIAFKTAPGYYIEFEKMHLCHPEVNECPAITECPFVHACPGDTEKSFTGGATQVSVKS